MAAEPQARPLRIVAKRLGLGEEDFGRVVKSFLDWRHACRFATEGLVLVRRQMAITTTVAREHCACLGSAQS